MVKQAQCADMEACGHHRSRLELSLAQGAGPGSGRVICDQCKRENPSLINSSIISAQGMIQIEQSTRWGSLGP